MRTKDKARMAAYLLSDERLKKSLMTYINSLSGNKSIKRKAIKNHIYWTALISVFGSKTAELKVTELLNSEELNESNIEAT